jgi:hypothetical protein
VKRSYLLAMGRHYGSAIFTLTSGVPQAMKYIGFGFCFQQVRLSFDLEFDTFDGPASTFRSHCQKPTDAETSSA